MKRILYLLVILAYINANGQSFFKPLRKVTEYYSVAHNKFVSPENGLPMIRTVMQPKDSTMNSWRPLANIAAYAEPGNILMAGAGLSYQQLKWDIVNQRWDCQWSIAAMGWAGGSVAPKTPADIVSYGLLFGFLNNAIMIGPALNAGKVIGVISIGINFNN